MKTLAMIIVVLTLTSCSKTEKAFDKFYWDPVKGMFRITYGIVKWTQHIVKAVAVHLNPMSGLATLTIAWIVYDDGWRCWRF